EQQVHEALTSVHDAVASVEQTLEGTVGAVAGTLGEIAGDALDTVGSAVGTLGGLAGNSLAIADDLLHGRVEPEDYLKLVGDLGQGVGATVGHAWEFGSDSLKAANDLYHAAYQGGSLSLGNSDGLLGVNVIGSLLGGNHDQGVIPDSRGILGPLPINVSFTEQGLTFGGETPLTPLVTAALALNPITAPLVPVLAPLNLGGLGVVGSVDKEGFSAKFYGIAGPSYNLGVANLGGTLELGSYNEVKLLSWNEVTLKDLPIVGGILGYVPVVKDIGVSLPTLDLHFDSKLYAQTIAGVDVAGVGPKGQIELVHDLDNDLSIVAGIAGDTAHSALDGAGKVLAALLGHGGEAAPPTIQLIGADPAPEHQALAA
ncbi:TPA: type I secretion system-dependent protein AprX, partial [Pseudomonas aeruginosa]